MRVTIVLEDHDGDQEVFTSMDWVRGTILLYLPRADALSKITLTLQGKLVSSVVAAATNPLDGSIQAVDTHKLFKLSQTIFPHRDVPIPTKGFSLPKGPTTLPFQFRLPVLSTCQKKEAWIRHLKTTLPPSFKFHSPKKDGYALVEYYLRVKVLRPGRFKSNLAAKKEFKFLPLDPGLPPPMMEPTRGATTRLLRYELPNMRRGSLASSPGSEQQVDARVVFLEATLPSPAILRLRSSLPLSIFVTAQAGVTMTSPPLILRSIVLAIQTETTVHIGPNLTTWKISNELVNVSDLETLMNQEERQEISKDHWKDAIVPDLGPSFTTCTLMQEHFFIVSAGFSYGPEGSIQTLKISINVELHTGIERQQSVIETSTPDEDENDDQMAFIPWRFGSERHLGILGRASSRPNNTPPPPY